MYILEVCKGNNRPFLKEHSMDTTEIDQKITRFIMWPLHGEMQQAHCLLNAQLHGVAFLIGLSCRCVFYNRFIIVRDGHGGGGSRKINTWHIYTLMVYL